MSKLYEQGDMFWWAERLGNPMDTSGWGLIIRNTAANIEYNVGLPDDLYVMFDMSGDQRYLLDELTYRFSLTSLPVTFQKTDFWSVDNTVLWENGAVMISAPDPFEIQTYDIRCKRVLEIFGIDPRSGVVPSFDAGNGQHMIVADKLHGLCWRSFRPADSKLTDIYHEQSTSGGRGYQPVLTRWGTDEVRTFSYSQVPAVHVRRGRGSIEAYSEVGKTPSGGVASPFDDFWEAAISSYAPIYCTHHVGTSAPSGWYTTPVGQREFLMAEIDSRYTTDLGSCLTRENRSSEHYSVEFSLRRTDENSANTYSQG